MADVDNDGKLNTEEFILSGHLVEMAAKGEVLPAALPPNLVPPSMRKPGSDMASTPGSVIGSVSGAESPAKSQAEMERRRQSLIEQQKKEEEEKKKKEKEEEEAREKQKQELERQRLAEWEKQRKEELVAHRQREQDRLLEYKARQDNLKSEFDKVTEKVQFLTTGISDSRTGVSDVKSFIDGMRSSRDTKMKELNDLKARLKEQNKRLLEVTQEKAQLEAKNKARSAKIAEGEDADENEELTEFEIKKIEKEKEVVALRESFEEVKAKENEAKEKFEGVKALLQEHRENLDKVIESCKVIYSEFDEKRRDIKAEKAKRMRELTDPDHAWGSEDPIDNGEVAPQEIQPEPVVGGADPGDCLTYRAIFNYSSENPDDLQFVEGDIIMVSFENDSCIIMYCGWCIAYSG